MKGNNKKIQALIEKRLNLGIKKFKQEMPVGLYTPEDILEGQNAGCSTIGVLSGASTYEELKACSPNIIINDIMDIKFI